MAKPRLKDKKSKPTKADHDSLRSFLIGKGFKKKWVDDYVGLTHGNRSRKDIARGLKNRLKTLPKKVKVNPIK